jgi:multidrug efflux pump subunit AcrA (membrane-fusion protein)
MSWQTLGPLAMSPDSGGRLFLEFTTLSRGNRTVPGHMSIRLSRYPQALALIGALAASAGCAPDNEYKLPPPVPVTVALPLTSDVTNFLEETGTTEAVAKAEVRARVRGFLEEVNFEPGTEVQEGDVLYVIQQREFQAKRDASKAAVDAEKVELEKAEIEYAR